MLDPHDILNGSRTTRPLTQLAFIFRREYLCRTMRRSLTRLWQRYKVRMVTPVILSSSGGGTGSAAQLLLMDLLRQPAFRHRLLSGLPSDALAPPMSFVCEPFAYVNETSEMQACKILANAKAFRIESEAILQQRAATYVTHIGYANEGGTVLADPDLMAKVLGNAVYEIERCWPELKARWVNGPDDVASMTHYLGQDSPQIQLRWRPLDRSEATHMSTLIQAMLLSLVLSASSAASRPRSSAWPSWTTHPPCRAIELPRSARS